jgi:hypothetical protein
MMAIDPELPFKVDAMNGWEAGESRLGLKALVARERQFATVFKMGRDDP